MIIISIIILLLLIPMVGAIYDNSNYNSNNTNGYSVVTNNVLNGNSAIYSNASMNLSHNIMDFNKANKSDDKIYNAGKLGILNLTYISNSTWIAFKGQTINLSAYLTDDMGNTVSGQTVLFYVNNTTTGGNVFIGSAVSYNSKSSVSYTVSQNKSSTIVYGNYSRHEGYYINRYNGTLVFQYNTTISTNISFKPNPITGVKVNETVNAIATVTNTGNSVAYNVTASIKLPKGFLNKSSIKVSHGTYNPATGIWNIGNLNPSETANMTFEGKF